MTSFSHREFKEFTLSDDITKHFPKKISHGVKQVKMNLWYNFHMFISYIGLVV